MRLPVLLAVPLVSLPALVAMPAQAALVQYAYTATVSKIAEIPGGTGTVNWLDSSTLAGPTISVGNTWTGTFFYDTDLALDTYQPGPEEHGSYQMYTGAIGSTITDAQTGLSFSSDPALSWLSRLSVQDSPDGAGSDSLSFTAHRSGTDFETGSFWFHDLHGNALASSAVPSSLALGDFQFARVSYSFLQDGTNNWMSADADITSLTLVTAPVPEPSTYAMLGLGLAALAMTKKLRRA
ncbi:PEP-CTERM sorting domain-containing protein [Pseudoduganella sp. SL102]|uniref:PEP-CTERM sorting domain-containing protein n=1 Tax=Pseudoduganella sp. SL102 TaxID=2995154 RepID=UPI00248B6C47|nr:PEP-CTERM sorting domain-containing protein [Pseudoduganella sp. SL102]WBS00465.1 PEP-CTERM sorting domain-containing protein [Pseudoduganella sp. SL102]